MRTLTLEDVYKSAVLQEAMKEKGLSLVAPAKAKLANVEVYPGLLDLVFDLTPEEAISFPVGTHLLEEDKLWVPVVDQLLGHHFDKKGLAFYFVTYVSAGAAMASLNSLDGQIRELSNFVSTAPKIERISQMLGGAPVQMIPAILQGMGGELGEFGRDLVVMLPQLQERETSLRIIQPKLEKLNDLLATQLGYLNVLEYQIPMMPKTTREKLAVWLWKKYGGATWPDYHKVSIVADKFLAESNESTAVKELVEAHKVAEYLKKFTS